MKILTIPTDHSRTDNDCEGNEIVAPKDWFTTLQKLAAGTHCASTYQKQQLADAAGSWNTCACGQLCTALPRNDCREPVDYKLRGLGLEFSARVQDENWRAALNTFQKIEERSTELLIEMGILKPEKIPAKAISSYAATMFAKEKKHYRKPDWSETK